MTFVQQLLIYGIVGAASRLAAVVLVPLYTRTLSIIEYGQLELLLAVHALIVILAGMQLESTIARDYFEAKASGRRQALAWATLMLTMAGSAVLVLLLIAMWQVGCLPSTFDGKTVAILAALTLPAQLFGVQLVMLRFEGSSLRFAVFSLCDLALAALFSVLFIVTMGLGVNGALLGVVSGKLVSIALAWSRTFGGPPSAMPSRALMHQMLLYSIPLVPAVLIGWVQNAGNRLLLAFALTIEDVAIAAIAIKVAAIYGFVVYSFRLAWEPYSMARLTSLEDDPHVYNRALEWYVATMFLACGIAILLAPYIVRLLAPPTYIEGGILAIFFLLGQFWVGVINLVVVGIHGARRTSLLIPVFGYGALTNVVLLFALTPLIGVSAAGVGFLSGSICSALIARHYSNQHFNTRFSARLFTRTTVATVLFLLIWYPVAFSLRDATASLIPAIGLFGAGTGLVVVLLSAIVFQAFEPGRAASMWGMLASGLRRG